MKNAIYDWDFKFDPQTAHDVDACDACHEANDHDDIEAWSEDCGACEAFLGRLVATGEYCLTHHEWYCGKDATIN